MSSFLLRGGMAGGHMVSVLVPAPFVPCTDLLVTSQSSRPSLRQAVQLHRLQCQGVLQSQNGYGSKLKNFGARLFFLGWIKGHAWPCSVMPQRVCRPSLLRTTPARITPSLRTQKRTL